MLAPLRRWKMKRVARSCARSASPRLGFASTAAARVLLVGSYKGIHGQYSLDPVSGRRRATRRLGPRRTGRLQDDLKLRAGRPQGHPGRGPDHKASDLRSRDEPQHGDRRRDQVRARLQPRGERPEPRSARLGRTSQGLNGIMVWKAANVWVQNLTVCNFLSGKGDAGNEIWWNGGDDSGKIGGHGYYGSYPSATKHVLPGTTVPPRSTGFLAATGPVAPGFRRTRATSATPATTSVPASSGATR